MDIRKISNQIAKQLGEDKDFVYDAIMYQFLFTKEVMQDPEDYHDILYNKLFRFTLKPRYKEDKTKPYKAV